ncbi:ABC transporter permease [Cellulophaga sp. F20128]|uniref:FtsX-like permease family protein n=1 Tax=Cellulophaga sp. F20128 TaxID=2926413 RepID=UPI001FF37327|nr:FtsX-like permease family protein [Cellulophaga sp. F20128]MCK0157515.1 ABC transporter permease [Cellulophaga sp. F20128]
MLRNYLKIAWRNLRRNKTFTFLNVLGLSVAFAVSILLAMSSFYELSFENFHKNKDRIFGVYSEQQTAQGPKAGTTQPTPFATALRDEVPGIAQITRVLEGGALVIQGNKEMTLDVIWVDPNYFSMFTFPLLQGKKGDELQNLTSVVLSEDAALKLFGSINVIGETVSVLINGKEKPFSVGAITKKNPSNTSFGFEMAIRFENNSEYNQTKDSWNAQYHQVYLQLEENLSAASFETNTQNFVSSHYQEAIENAKRDGAVANKQGLFRMLKLLPLKDHRFTSYKKGQAVASRSTPYLILGVAFLILFIACVNFINMRIAMSAQRLKEIGMRKTLGARKKQLFVQFWSESLLVFVISICFGLLLSVLLINDFKTIFRTEASLTLLATPIILGSFVALVFAITVLVGGYPALLMSRIGTIQSLKGKVLMKGKNRVRDILIVVQFGIAILLISGTLVLRGQIEFMRNINLGFDKEQVISFPLNGKKNSYTALNLLKHELKGNPDILSVSGADNNLGMGKDGSLSSSVIGFEYKGKVTHSNFLVIDYNYVPTLGLELVKGRNFTSAADSLGVLINEAMAKQLGEKDPLAITLNINGDTQSPVYGVLKDYHFQGLDKSIEPIMFFMSRDLGLSYAYVKVRPENLAKSFDTVESTWQKIEPNASFLGSFLNDNIDRTFRREKSLATMITSGSIIAIILSCIGLFAMSMLIVAQRTKEIGIRKVIGASVGSIAFMLTKDFLKLVAIAFIIATPIAWYFLYNWLQNYAFRINLNWWLFAIAGVMVLGIATVTIGLKTIKAARANPVQSLRTE